MGSILDHLDSIWSCTAKSTPNYQLEMNARKVDLVKNQMIPFYFTNIFLRYRYKLITNKRNKNIVAVLIIGEVLPIKGNS